MKKKLYWENNVRDIKKSIFVKTLTGKLLKIRCKLTEIVGNVKYGIYFMEGIPVDQQSLVYCGKQLQDNRHLKAYNITYDCTIHLVLRLR